MVIDYKFLSRKFEYLATRAYISEECCILIENAIDNVSKVVEEKLKHGNQVNPDDGCNTQVVHEKSNDLLTAARLKKKYPRKNTRKRKKSFTEKFHKKKNKNEGSAEVIEVMSHVSHKKIGAAQHKVRMIIPKVMGSCEVLLICWWFPGFKTLVQNIICDGGGDFFRCNVTAILYLLAEILQTGMWIRCFPFGDM